MQLFAEDSQNCLFCQNAPSAMLLSMYETFWAKKPIQS